MTPLLNVALNSVTFCGQEPMVTGENITLYQDGNRDMAEYVHLFAALVFSLTSFFIFSVDALLQLEVSASYSGYCPNNILNKKLTKLRFETAQVQDSYMSH